MIKLYTDKTLLTAANRPHVHPLLFDLHYYEHADPLVQQHYCLVDAPSQADAFILPLNYLAVNQAAAFYILRKAAKEHNKKLHIYTGGDYGKTFKEPDIVTWRNAGFKSSNSLQTIIVPAFMSHPIASGRVPFKVHEFKSKPAISFTGFATASLRETARVHLATFKANVKRVLQLDQSDVQKAYNAAGKRVKYLKALEASNALETHFIYRDTYRAGAKTPLALEQTTQAFFDNINSTPYTFCMRGAGNFSARFYEALACGRVPVLVDTDVVLPLESHIPWNSHICRILPNKDIVECLLAFHQQFDAVSFKRLQESNRALYEQTLLRHHYFCAVHNLLKTTV
jgi:hypothetical protein